MDGYENIKSPPIRQSVQKKVQAIKALPEMPKLQISCGKAGGLPFDYLMTDIMSGCLPIEKICYGNCSAAEYWIDKGYDFGKKIVNDYNEDYFKEALQKLPSNQRWLRQGWASDCSFYNETWGLAAKAAKVSSTYDISMLIITKGYVHPSDSIIRELVEANAELRVSLSAFDTKAQINHRLKLLEKYRSLGGKSIPYIMTAKYSDDILDNNQQEIIRWIIEGDYIAGEHPLRLNRDNSGLKSLAEDGLWHPKFPDQYWFGRLLDHIPNFILPAPTHLKPEYTLEYKTLSEVGGATIEGIEGNLPTYSELKEGEILHNENLFKHATYEIKQ